MGRKPTVNLNLPSGLFKRTVKSRGKEYSYYSYQISSNPRKEIRLGSDYAAAIFKWAELNRKASSMPPPKPTFLDLKIRYVAEVLPLKAPRTQKDNLREIESLSSFFGNPPAPLDEIKPIHVRQFLQWRTKSGKGQVRANREKALFSHMFNFAREQGLTDATNPCAGVKGFSESGRDIYVEDDAFKLVLDNACKPVAFAMRLAYLTGQRPADLIALERTDIKNGCISFTQQKTGTRLRIEVQGELAELIGEMEAYKRSKNSIHPRLLCNESGADLTYDALRQRFDKARTKAKLTHHQIQFRDLRAKAATDKAESSGDIRQAQKQLGHANLSMTEHYTRQRKGDLVKPTK